MKQIKTILPATARSHWVGDGFNVRAIFAQLAFTQEISPFLMFDYAAPREFAATEEKRGVGPHPHRGFETVTIAFQGEVEITHRQSRRDRAGRCAMDDRSIRDYSRKFRRVNFEARRPPGNGAAVGQPVGERQMIAPKYQPILSRDIPGQLAETAAQSHCGQFYGTQGLPAPSALSICGTSS
jgi:redox-sensitive bicupin YhaK (pirin superfamily)